MRVTVVIANYNYGAFITETLMSVLNQTYQDWEVVVVDDGSTDNSREILEGLIARFNGKLKYVVQKNQGVSVARNTAIKIACGEFIAFLDADDLWSPDCLASLVELMDSDAQLGLVYGNVSFFESESRRDLGTRFGAKGRLVPYTGKCVDKLFLTGSFVPTSACMVRRSVLDQVGNFDHRFSVGEDYDLWLRIAVKSDFGYVDKIICQRRRHLISASRDYFSGAKAHFFIFKKILRSFPELRTMVSKKIINEKNYLSYYELGRHYVLSGHPRRGRALLCRALVIDKNPFRNKILIYFFATGPFLNKSLLYLRRFLVSMRKMIFGVRFHN